MVPVCVSRRGSAASEPRRALQKSPPIRVVIFFAHSSALTVVSAASRPLLRRGSRDTSSKPPRFIRRRRHFGAFLVAGLRAGAETRVGKLAKVSPSPALFLAICGGTGNKTCGRSQKETPSERMVFLSLSKKSGWSWAFSDRYGRMDKGDERCWNAGKWIEI